MRDVDDKALSARNKKSALGPDIDIDVYPSEPVPHEYVRDLQTLSEADKKRMILAGIVTDEKQRSGTYIQKDTPVLHACFTKDQSFISLPVVRRQSICGGDFILAFPSFTSRKMQNSVSP